MTDAYRIPYRTYKQHYADCQTVPGTYHEQNRTIEVIIPPERFKPSGTRGKRYGYYYFTGTETSTGRAVHITIKAVCVENARKQLPRDCTWNLQ